MKKLLFGLALFGAINVSAQKADKLALTPPMGWNSWNKFACEIDEAKIREVADAMVSSGMKDAGYQYIVIDDCWHGERDSLGFIHPDPKRFPSGIKALADYVHSKGLKFGIYSDVGYKTCGGRIASRGHEFQDALTYAKWGVDYLKYDWCNSENINAIGAYTTMRDALFESKRQILFSMCEWGQNKPWEWAQNVGHMWRTTGDIFNCFDCEKKYGTWSAWGVMKIIDMQKDLRKYAGPGHWNDPDMLEVGNGLNDTEGRAHFSMWAIMASPLITGNDLSTMSATTKEILTNKEVIAVNQDPLGEQARVVATPAANLEVWSKKMTGTNVRAVALFNRGTSSASITVKWTDIGIPAGSATVRDLWAAKDVGPATDSYTATGVASHSVVMLKIASAP